MTIVSLMVLLNVLLRVEGRNPTTFGGTDLSRLHKWVIGNQIQCTVIVSESVYSVRAMPFFPSMALICTKSSSMPRLVSLPINGWIYPGSVFWALF